MAKQVVLEKPVYVEIPRRVDERDDIASEYEINETAEGELTSLFSCTV